MSEYRERAKQLQDSIAAILLHEWDPIGVADVPEAQDEYDSYVPQVYGLLVRREGRQKLIDYLWWAETVNMELRGNLAKTSGIADRLLQLVN